MIKPQTRILGIDDGPLAPWVLVVGVVFRGGSWMDGLVSCTIQRDGLDATNKITEMVSSCRYKDLRFLMTDGVTFAGFNTINIRKLHMDTGLPVIVVTRRNPNYEKIRRALERLPYKEKRWKDIEDAGDIHSISLGAHSLFFQYAGAEREEVEKILHLTSIHSLLPEPVRIAHIIATGVVGGEATKKP
jgi:hypothetical protein